MGTHFLSLRGTQRRSNLDFFNSPTVPNNSITGLSFAFLPILGYYYVSNWDTRYVSAKLRTRSFNLNIYIMKMTVDLQQERGMKQKITGLINLVHDRLALIGICLGGIFWMIESFMHVYVFHQISFVESVFSPEAHEAWMRLIIVGMFISFGIYAQLLMNARKQAQTALSIANAELTQIFETSADGMRVIDRTFNMLRANETFCELTDIRKEDALGKKCYEVFRGHLCHTDACPLTRILGGEDRVECDSEKIPESGPEIQCIVTATPFKGPNGEVIGIVEDFKDISERKRTEKELIQSRRRLRELASHLESAREMERTRIAREIHDELGQSLTALKMELHWCLKRLPKDDEKLLDKAKTLLKLVDANVHLVQRISSELRPGLLDNLGLSAAMEWQTGQFQDRTGISCDIICEPNEIVLDHTRSTALFRIFQETLTNIIRHADATRVEIALRAKDGDVELTVTDNGKGITEQEISDPKSFGLMGINERVYSLGGSVVISGSKDEGTTVRVNVPAGRSEDSKRAENTRGR
jgi:PAS domain S-box-containing protein